MSESKPKSTRDVPKRRKCLRCTEQFFSMHSGERICGTCRHSQDWQNAGPSERSFLTGTRTGVVRYG